MKTLRCLFLFAAFSLDFAGVRLTAAEHRSSVSDASVTAAIIAADDERGNAFKHADAAALASVLADELRYAHSNGKIDTKASLTASLVSGQSVYTNFDYQERMVTVAGPGVALMSGRVLVGVRGATGHQTLDLNYLAVWREEQGKWRFLAWQSCRNPAPTSAPPATPPQTR